MDRRFTTARGVLAWTMASMVVLVLAAMATAQQPPVPAWTQSGDWDSQYESLGAGIIRSRFAFANGQGEYTVGVSKGRLSNIRYYPQWSHPVGPPTPAIVGTWELLLDKGYFVFRAPDQQGKFDGYWGFFTPDGKLDRIIGSWDALPMSAKGPVLPTPVPAPAPIKPAVEPTGIEAKLR